MIPLDDSNYIQTCKSFQAFDRCVKTAPTLLNVVKAFLRRGIIFTNDPEATAQISGAAIE
jgi:hypothetical protein